MNTVKSSAHLAVASLMRSWDQSVGSSIERSSPGPAVPFSGVENNPVGGEWVVGWLVISLFAAALLTPFERLIPQERNGSKSSRSTSTGSHQRRRSGGTGRGPYDEK